MSQDCSQWFGQCTGHALINSIGWTEYVGWPGQVMLITRCGRERLATTDDVTLVAQLHHMVAPNVTECSILTPPLVCHSHLMLHMAAFNTLKRPNTMYRKAFK